MKAVRSPVVSGKELLVRPSPIGLKGEKPVESFFSWLSRLSWANGFKDAQSLLLAENIGRNWNTDIGSRAKRIQLLRLGGQDERALNSLSLANVLSIVGVVREPQYTTKWILRDPYSNDLPHQVCVKCLAEEDVPYWSRDSRASFTTQCRIHHAILLDYCPACNARLVLTKNRTAPLRLCGACRFDLTLAPALTLQGEQLVPAHWNEPGSRTPHPGGIGWVSKEALWEGLSTILKFVCSPHTGRKLLQARIAVAHHRLFEMIQEKEPTAFDFHRTDLRHHMLVFAGWLMECWPERILEMCSQAGLHKPLHTSSKGVRRNWALAAFCFTKVHLPLEERYAGTFAEAP